MNKILLLIFLYPIFISCFAQDCQEGINLRPMYGNVTKCPQQLQGDKDFIASADSQFKDRKTAAVSYVRLGWDYFYKNDLETSMKRFNHARLLDSLNADIYWGFGNLLGRKGELKASIPHFEKSLKLNPNNAKVYESLATSFGQLFVQTRSSTMLDKAVAALRSANGLDRNNPRILAQLTAAYTYYNQKDSAYKYLELTDKIDPEAIRPQVRALLKKK